jgi:hypothetical protein
MKKIGALVSILLILKGIFSQKDIRRLNDGTTKRPKFIF